MVTFLTSFSFVNVAASNAKFVPSEILVISAMMGTIGNHPINAKYASIIRITLNASPATMVGRIVSNAIMDIILSGNRTMSHFAKIVLAIKDFLNFGISAARHAQLGGFVRAVIMVTI
jgi:hypothetical protein